MEVIGCVRAKKSVGSSEPRNSTSGYRKTPVLPRFSCRRYRVCSCQKICRKFGTPKLCIRPRNARFASFFMQSPPKSSKTLPKHHLGPNGGNWVYSYESRESGTTYVRVPKNTNFASIFVQEVTKRTKTLSIIILGLMEVIGCVRVKKFVGSSEPPNSTFLYRKTPVLPQFLCSR